jgi:hypothetical protein
MKRIQSKNNRTASSTTKTQSDLSHGHYCETTQFVFREAPYSNLIHCGPFNLILAFLCPLLSGVPHSKTAPHHIPPFTSSHLPTPIYPLDQDLPTMFTISTLLVAYFNSVKMSRNDLRIGINKREKKMNWEKMSVFSQSILFLPELITLLLEQQAKTSINVVLNESNKQVLFTSTFITYCLISCQVTSHQEWSGFPLHCVCVCVCV